MISVNSSLQRIGRYEILRELGRGAMGVVFKARDPFIGRCVAVKTITAGVAENLDLLERFYREAKAAGGLQHPNIVTIYEMSESDGFPFIAMEYLEGESLGKVIARRPPLPLAQKLGYIVQACRALDYAHHRGVIHRDIKPANIMVTPEGVVKVVDFGIARITDSSKTQTGTLLGTLAYMSPQQVRGQHASESCDVWSLGVVLYELVSYERPFKADNHGALLLSILQDEPRSIRELMPQCPADLETVVQRALCKEASGRYQTMETLLVDLEPIWSSLQRETVQKMVHEGRQLIEQGKLPEACDMLRQSLAIDMTNLTAKALLDKVNASLGEDQISLQVRERVARGAKLLEEGLFLEARAEVQSALKLNLQDPAARRLQEQVRSHEERAREKWNQQKTQSIQSAQAEHGNPPESQQFHREIPEVTASRSAARFEEAHKRTETLPATVPLDSGLVPPIGRRSFWLWKRAGVYLACGTALAFALGFLAYRRHSTSPHISELKPNVGGPSAPLLPSATTTPPLDSASASDPAVPIPSLQDQQRRLIELAHAAANSNDYKAAEAHLDEAEKLDGSLNPIFSDLRRQFAEQARDFQLRQVARQERTLWEGAMKYVDGGNPEDAEKLLREILILPEGGHRRTDAERYVDETIPLHRHEDQLWENAQQEAQSASPGHLLNEVRALDQLLAVGGPHLEEARQMRDSLMLQFARNNARTNHLPPPVVSNSDRARLAQLEAEFVGAVQKSDAGALGQLQALRPRFKAMADSGTLVADARDYMNNLIPRAQKQIEERLANAESNAEANAQYERAVGHYDQAVSAKNLSMLRSQVLPDFQHIAQSGGARAQEAAQYVNVMIPQALKGSVH
jgi:serine/threonine protein kinase